MKVGEVYRDKDPRMGERYVLVVATNGGRKGDKAVCVPCFADGKRHFEGGTGSTTISAKTLSKRFEFVAAIE